MRYDSQMLEKKGVRNYLVEFGGEMRVKGVNPSGMDWRLGITKLRMTLPA